MIYNLEPYRYKKGYVYYVRPFWFNQKLMHVSGYKQGVAIINKLCGVEEK